MKKYDFTKMLAWPLVFGAFLGLALAKFEINLIDYIIPILILLVIIIIAVSAYYMKKEANYQQTLLNEGRYDELIKYMTEKHEQAKGKMGYRQQYLYGIANCYNRMGQFQVSLNYLQDMEEDKMDNNLKAGYYVLYAANLYFLNRDLNKAEELIIKSRELLDMPESILLHALINIELGKREEANNLIELYLKKPNEKKYKLGIYTIMYIDEFSTNVSEKFMLGLCYKKLGEEEKSKRYLTEAADCGYWNYFSDLAKEMSD